MAISRKKKKERKEYIYAGLIGSFVFIIFISLAWYKFNNKQTLTAADLCPIDTELISGHTIFLIDSTDKLTKRQEDAIEVNLINKINSLSEYHRVSIFSLTDEIDNGRRPVISICTPRRFDKSRDNEFTTSKEYLNNYFKKHFKDPLDSKLKLLANLESKVTSPILEMLQLVKIDGFDRYALSQNSTKRLVIYSDMLHNTKNYTHFRNDIGSYKAFEATPYAMKVIPNLRGTLIEINMLMNHPEFQGMQLVNFWRELIKDRGGVIESIERFPG